MSRGPPHRSSSYGYYGGPPFKRPRRHSSDEDISPPPVNYGPAYFDPPYVRHQEVGLGEFNDFSSVSVEKDLKIHERDGSRKDYERPESHTRMRQSSTEGIGHFSQHQTTSAPTSPHSTKVSPRFSPRHSPRARPVTPPSSSAASQPLSITTSQPTLFSRAPSLSSSDEPAAVGKHHPLLIVCPTSSHSAPAYVPIVRDKLKDGTGRPASLSSLSLHGGFNRKDSYPGPAVEAISPSAPASESHVDKDGEEKKGVKDATSDMLSKDELLQGMEKVDREITQVKQQINNLKKMQKQLEDEACKQPDEPQKEEIPVPEPKPRSVVQIIYEENRKKAEAAQARLAKLGVPLPGGKPLYNQPSDLACYHENLRKAPAIKAKLVKYFQLRKQAKEMKNRQLCKEYKTLKQAWLTKMERHENNPKRKNKEAKLREFYEKVFPEIKKQREQTERFSRMGSRSNWGIVARSEAEFNEIVDNLNEQEANERHMRTLAVDPPPILDKEERRVKFINRNGLIRDPLAALNERKHKNIWTEKERRIFKDKFIHNPKDFDLISSFLPGKCVADCILFYYQTKKKEHYKQLSRRHNLKKRRRDQYGTTAGAPANKTRPGASESSAKGDHGGYEGEQELEEITDSAEESEENEEHPPPPVTTPQVATPTPPPRRPDHVETSRWSEKEIEIALQGLRECGRDWEAIAQRVVTKTGAQCKNFYFNYKKKLHLEDLVAEHEKTKMQRAQQQQKHQQQQPREQQRHQQQPQQPQQKEISSLPEKHEPTPKQSLDTSHPNKSNVKSNNATPSNVSTTNERVSTPVVVNTMSNPVGPPGTVQTASTTASISSLQLAGSRTAPSHSPRLPLTSSTSTLFMPTPGVIASIGRASPNVGTSQPGQVYFRPTLIESMKQDTPHSSRSSHPESLFTGLVYPRAVDPSRLRPEFLVSSHPMHPPSDSHPLYQGSPVPKHLPQSTSSHPSNSVHSTKGVIHPGSSHTMTSHPGSSHAVTSHPGSYAVTSHPGSSHVTTSHPGSSHTLTSHPGSSHSMTSHSMTSHPGSSHSLTSHPGTLHSMTSYPGTSHTITSHPGISHTGKSHSEDTHGHSASEPGHVPVSSIVFAPSDPSASSHTHRSRPSSHSPVIVAPQDKPHSQVSFLKEGSAVLYSSHKPTYLSTYPGSIRPEPPGRSSKTDDGRRDISSDMLHNPAIVPEPDVIVIDADDHKKRMEGYPRLETAEGKQASSMLRRLASAGIGPSAEHMAPVTEPVRPQSLPLTSSTRLMSHTETKVHRSTTPPSSSMAARQSALNPPPPLIQMSSSREKKYAGTQDTAQESSRPREGYVHSEPYQERYLHVSQDTSAGRDILRHTHTPVDNRGGERERRTPVVETVDLTRDREVSTSPLTRPTSRSPVVTLSSSSARATLQKMAMYASAETNSADASEKIAQKKREETYLPPRAPDPKLSVYEQSEAIRKFTSLGNVCVSAPREFPVGGEYPSQPYALMAMQAQHQPHVHPHPAGTSTPPPYGYPFHMGHSMGSFHHHPEHRFLVPIGVHQILPHSVNGEELPSHIKLSGAYAHQYPQGASYFPAGIRPVVPTYQPMTVCGHRYPVPLTEERRAMPHAVEVPARRHNDISEQDLAHPFVVRQSRHMHAPGISERMSPSELPKFPLPSRSPGESAKRPRTTSPEMKPQVAQHAEAAKAISPPAATYLSRIPTRPASVSEMRNRAAVIPELKDTETVSQTFPEPQPVVVPTSQHSSREEVGSRAEQSNDRNTKQEGEDDKGGSLTEGLPMSAFATLVDVAAAARKVDVPFYEQEKHERPVSIGETTLKKETSDLQEVYGSSHARITGPAMMSPTGVSSPPSPTRTSPGMPGAPRYGISTGLVPKPPPLMPITGMRSMQEENSFSSTPLSVSDGGHGSASLSRSPSKLTSPPGTRARVSVSPDGPPPLISRSVISPTGSSQGPPPLIRGIVSPVQPALRSPESEADSTVKTGTNQEPMHQQRPDQEPSVSEGAFPIGASHIDPDLQKTFWMHLHESVPVSSQRADGDDAKKLSSTSHRAGHSQVSTIVETRTYLDSARAELRHPSRHHVVSFQPSTSVRQSSPLPSSSSALVTETREATSVGEVNTSREAASGRWTPTENERNIQRHTQPEQSHSVHGRSGEIDKSERVQESCQVNKKAYSLEQESETSYRNRQASSPQHEPSVEASISHTSGSETEEGDEGELDTEVHSSSASLHPRVRALARSSQSNLQPCYDASDSETLSAEESEVLPESSDEMFPSTTVKVYTEADNVCEGRRDVEREDILRDSGFSADTSVADTIAPLPSTSRDYSDNEEEHMERSHIQGEEVEKSDAFEDVVTSTRLLSSQVPDLKTKEPTEDFPTTSTLLDETRQHIELPEVDVELEEEIDVSTGQEISEETSESSDQELQPSQSSNLGDPAAEEDSSEALPTSVYEDLEQEDTVAVQSSEDSLVGSSETDIAAAQPQVESSHQQVSEDIPDSSANLEVMPDVINTSSPLGNIDTSITMDDNTTTADQSLMEEEGDLVTDADSADACPSTSGTAKYNIVAPVLDQSEEVEEINEADTLENPPSEHGFLNEPDTFSPSSENQPPEISSAMDDVCDDGDHLSCPTFIGEFVPLPGEVDSPDIRSGCSTLIASEASSVCDENISERELKDVCEPAPSNQEEPSGVLSPDERAHQTDDTLSEGEIPPSQESSQSEDELTSVEEKPVSNEATAVASSEAMEKPQSVWYSESTQPVTDRDRLPSQSKETVDDEQLSEGEIPESEDKPTVETSQGSPSSNAFPVSSTVSGGDADGAPVATRRTSVVSSSQETTEQTECYINMIPISPAPPESPSHESEVDRTSPLPQWSPIDTQYSSVMSLSLASRITPFPYSTLSFNVGSADSSARSSPVPQALAVSLASGSSPSSSSLLLRPQEPTPLLSDNYEPLSDDDDDGLADTSNISEENG